MVNCNPETVSTDYDTSDRLYFEPLTFEDVLEVYQAEHAAGPVAGVIVQLGGQTPLGLAQRLADAGVPILGTAAGGDRRRPRTAARSAQCSPTPGCRRRRSARPRRSSEAQEIAERHRLPGARAPVATCSAAAAWRSSTTTSSSTGYVERALADAATIGTGACRRC